MLTLLTSDGRGWRGIEAHLCRIPLGPTKVSASQFHRVSLHFGTSVNTACRCDGRSLRRVQSQGDADVIPAGLDGEWEDDATCTILRLFVATDLVLEAAEAIGHDLDQVNLVPQFQLRDRRIENIGWTLKEELDAESGSDPLFAESLARALAVRLVHNAGWSPTESFTRRQVLSPRQLRRLQEFVDQNLNTSLTLTEMARVVGISVSHLSTLFRQTTGTSLHQYVIHQRVERAKGFLLEGQISISDVALEVGFANQSHLSRSMRRVLGVSPGALIRSSG